MAQELQEIHAIISGRVQGVGYRFFAQRCAEQLDIKGWVRNSHSEDVETVAQGTKNQLESYIDRLKQGPRSAFVTHVEVEWRSPTQVYEYFSITY